MTLLRLAIKSIIDKKARFFLTALAVVLGVMFTVGTFIITDGLRSTFDELADNIAGDADLTIRSEQRFGDRSDSPPIPVEVADVAGGVPDVLEAYPNVGTTGVNDLSVYDKDGKKVESALGSDTITFGFNWEDSQLSNLFLVDGKIPEGDKQFAVDADTALDGALEIGEEYEISFIHGDIGSANFELAGIFNFADPDDNRTVGAQLVAFDTETALELFNGGSGYDIVSIQVRPGSDIEAVTEDIKAALESSDVIQNKLGLTKIEIVDNQVISDEASDIFSFVDTLGTGLLVFAFIILAVSVFVIYNTFSIVLGQRVRELGLLRALGSTSGQVGRMVIGEAAVVGFVSSLVGLGAGFGVAAVLQFLLRQGGLDVGGLVLNPVTVIVAFAVGMGVTFISAFMPSFRSGRVAPMAALRTDASIEEKPAKRLLPLGIPLAAIGALLLILALFSQWIGLIFLSLIGVAFLALGMRFVSRNLSRLSIFATGSLWLILSALLDLKAGEKLTLFAVGALIFFVGVNLISPFFSSAVARVIGKPFEKIFGVTGVLSGKNAARNPKRTSATAGALIIGLALVSLVSVFASSIKATFSDVLRDSVNSDYFVCSGQCDGGPDAQGSLSPALTNQLQDLSGRSSNVDSVMPVRFENNAMEIQIFEEGEIVEAEVVGFTGVDFPTLERHFDFDIVSGNPANGSTNSVLVYSDAANRYNLTVGDRIPVEFSSNAKAELQVLGIFDDIRVSGSEWIISNDLIQESFGSSADAVLFYSVVSTSAGEAEIEAIIKSYDDVNLLSKEEFNKRFTEQIDQALVVFNILLGLAFVIAILGIANTLALSVFERTREIGLLRAVGMKRREMRRMFRLEGLIVAAYGGVMGVGMGLLLGIIGVFVAPDDFVNTLSVNQSVSLPLIPISLPLLLVYFVAAAVAGLLSALFPAYKAGRMNVLDAISHEN